MYIYRNEYEMVYGKEIEDEDQEMRTGKIAESVMEYNIMKWYEYRLLKTIIYIVCIII